MVLSVALSEDDGQEVNQGCDHLKFQLELENLIQNGTPRGSQVGAGV